MFGVDEGTGAAGFLRLGDDLERERGLAGAFRPVNLDDAAARQAADAERDVETERTGGNHLGLTLRRDMGAKLHDRAFAEGALDLAERRFERLLPIGVLGFFVVVFQKAQMLWLLLRHPPLLFLGQALLAINPIDRGGIVQDRKSVV